MSKGSGRREPLIPKAIVLANHDALDWRNNDTPTVLPPACKHCRCRPCEGSDDACDLRDVPTPYRMHVEGSFLGESIEGNTRIRFDLGPAEYTAGDCCGQNGTCGYICGGTCAGS